MEAIMAILVILAVLALATVMNVREKKKRSNMPPEELEKYLRNKKIQQEYTKAQKQQREASKPTTRRERIKRNREDAVACCPKCGSTSLSAHKKGFGVGKSAVGGLIGVGIAGPVGLIALTAGNAGAKKVRVTCLNCGKQFWAGKR